MKLRLQNVKSIVSSIYPELLLQTMADMRGGTLDQIDNNDFILRENIFNKVDTKTRRYF